MDFTKLDVYLYFRFADTELLYAMVAAAGHEHLQSEVLFPINKIN